mmetsp:Transcript_35376/g.85616  ORF Transcript_35376/g.85616 Transcript_35376/m.85616 type:complete len:113 (-) Transcript_35376:1371-1709(-)
MGHYFYPYLDLFRGIHHIQRSIDQINSPKSAIADDYLDYGADFVVLGIAVPHSTMGRNMDERLPPGPNSGLPCIHCTIDRNDHTPEESSGRRTTDGNVVIPRNKYSEGEIAR